jgi:hypothetical protein
MYLDSNGVTEIGASDLGNIIAGSTFAQKFGIQNVGSRVTGAITTSKVEYYTALIDGISQLQVSTESLIVWARDTETLSCPFNVAAALAAGGSLVVATEYFYKITAFNELGETGGSLEISATPTTGNQSVTLSWDAIAGAEGYCIYRSTDQVYTSARRMVIEDPATLSWTDTGQDPDPSSAYGFPAINTDYDLPAENTTAGESPDYGIAPTLSASDIIFSSLQPGEQAFFWIGVLSTIATPEANNPRMIIFSFPETL